MKSKKPKGEKSSVAEIIAKSCGLKSLDYDPTLSDLFSSNKYQIKVEKQEVLNSGANSDYQKVESLPDTNVRIKKESDLKLSHKDAASIRVNAKRKSRESSLKYKEINNDGIKKRSSEKKKKSLSVKAKSKKGKLKERGAESEETLSQSDELINDDVKFESHDSLESKESEVLENEAQENKIDTKDKLPSIAELNAPKDKNPEAEARTVFVGNVPKDFTTKKLKKLFKDHGEIEAVRFRGAAPSKPTQLKKVAIFRHEIHPDRNSLVAFVRYKTREEAERAMQLMNGIKIDEHHLTVDLADNKTKDETKAIFIGNLYLKLNDDDLWNYFEECGKIHSVRIVRDPITGLGKGIGFVNFQDSAGVELALKKNGNDLKGRPIRVSRAAVNKKKRKTAVTETTQSSNRQKRPNKPSARSNTWKLQSEEKHKSQTMNFTGDQTAEIGKLKRKSSKPNRGDVRKARFAKQLTGNSVVKRANVKTKK